MDHASLVGMVKELQRSNPQARELWIAFTSQRGGGSRDPAKLDEALLQEFVYQIESGEQLPGQGGGLTVSDKSEPELHVILAEGVQALQHRTPLFKQAWEQFCTANAGGNDDPSVHDNDSIVNFFNALAACNMAAGGMTALAGQGGMMGGVMAATPAAKRMRTAMGMPIEKDLAVSRLKAFLRSGDESKELWILYADQYLAGVRDPTRHDAGILKEFCDNHEVPELDGTMPVPAEVHQSGASAGGMWGDASSTAGAPGRLQLVNRVKAFVKTGAEAQELWGLYADTYLGGQRDPSSHDATILEEFCNNHGVPDIQKFHGIAAGVGGAGQMPGMGGHSAGASPKAVMVEKVNGFRCLGIENEAAWIQFAGPQANDPDGVMFFKLQEFCTTWSL